MNNDLFTNHYISNLLENKTMEHVNMVYELVMNYKDWANGQEYKPFSYWVNDIELNWMKGNEFIENM